MKTLFLVMIFGLQAQALQKLKTRFIAPSQYFEVRGDIELPSGQKLNKGAPSNVTLLEQIKGQWEPVGRMDLKKIFTVSEKFQYSFAVKAKSDHAPLKIKASLYHCNKVTNKFCVIDDFEGEILRDLKSSHIDLVMNFKGTNP